VKAAAFYEYGPADAMQYAAFPEPISGPGDVLVQVQACGVNHSDLDSRAGTSGGRSSCRWSSGLSSPGRSWTPVTGPGPSILGTW